MSVPPPPSGMGLYADLLADPTKKSSTGSIISSAPVKYNLKPQVEPELAAKKKDASLQFQPTIRRPLPKKKTAKPLPPMTVSDAPATTATSSNAVKPAGIEYWLEKGNDHNYVRPRPKWYKDKKNKKKQYGTHAHAWDDIYDPSRPNNYRAYKGSEEQYREVSEWKDRLYFRVKGGRPQKTSEEPTYATNPMFAPPTFDSAPRLPDEVPAAAFDYATGEDAFARRGRMSTAAHPQSSESVSPQPLGFLTDHRAELATSSTSNAAVRGSFTDHQAQLATSSTSKAAVRGSLNDHHSQLPTSSTSNAAVRGSLNDHQAQLPTSSISNEAVREAHIPPPPSEPTPMQPPLTGNASIGATIARAPVRYAVPEEPPTLAQPGQQQQVDEPVHEAPTRPPKQGFGKRLLEKQGWKEGEGLGARSEGITTAIVAKAEKRKKRSDAEGGGWVQPRNMGKIVGGKRRKIDGQEDEPAMSTVIKIPGMLAGLDVRHEIEEKNLQQELGDWFDQNYGKVERVFIWRAEQGGDNDVFIKFTNAISALKAVNPTDVLTFAGNEVNASFFDASKFDSGEY